MDIKEAVEKLLEQPEDPMMEDPMMEDPMAEEEASAVLDQVPSAATDGTKLCQCPENEDEVWEFSLDDIAQGLEAEGGHIDASDMVDSLQFAEETLGDQRDDEEIELELQESALMDIISDYLSSMLTEEEDEEDEDEEDEGEAESSLDTQPAEEVENVNESLIKENKQLISSATKNEKTIKALKEQNDKYKTLVEKLKERLDEVNLSNAKLLYTNRILENNSLNERQKDVIVEKLSSVGSVEEAKTIFETLQSAVGSALNKKAPKSLNEVVKNGSSAFLPRKEEKHDYSFKSRMQILAGIDK